MTFAAYSHAIRLSLSAAGYPVQLGHVQQMLAAALGYKSLAAYQSATAERFGSQVLVDMPLLATRCAELSKPKFEHIFVDHFAGCSAQTVHADTKSLEEMLSEHIQLNAADHDDLSGVIAETNATPTAVEDVEVMGMFTPMTLRGPHMVFPFFAVLDMDHDPDRVYHGDKIILEGSVSMEVTGRRCLGDFELSVTGKVEDQWEESL